MGFYSSSTNRIGTGVAKVKDAVFDIVSSQLLGDDLYDFTTFTFTSANTSGRSGPSLSTLLASYTNEPWATNSEFFSATGGVQLWTVPASGAYEIEAAGASGSPTGSNGGAIVRGTFNLIKNEKIQILVGQIGTGNGGGGGSFVVKQSGTQNSDVYVIAGAGGGKPGGDGGTSTTSNSSNSVNNGNGGNADFGSWNGPAGGGFFTSGQRSTAGQSRNPGYGFLQGGFGGEPATGEGGFGGGGSGGADSIAGGGAGGGYSGGSGRGDGTSGEGGGSYPNGESQFAAAGANRGPGYVKITRIV